MSLRVQEMMNIMDELAPPYLAVENDAIGLQIGDPQAEVKNIITTLDVDEDTIKEARERDANLIISHHPLIFSPLSSIDYSDPKGKLIKEIIHNNMNVFVAHTNLDVTSKGVNDLLCQILDISAEDILTTTYRDDFLKLVVFIPHDYLEKVRESISEAGAGWIGNYSHCTFSIEGTGTFLPLENTSPFQGEKGRLEKVQEYRLETIFPLSLKNSIISALLESHPYEEPAYDLYLLHQQGILRGLGRTGALEVPVTLQELALRCKQSLDTHAVRYWGDANRQIERVALCGGSGGNLISEAYKKGADVLISGDFKYHDVDFAYSIGLALIDAGHYATEYPIVPWLASYLEEKLQERGTTAGIHPVKGGSRENII